MCKGSTLLCGFPLLTRCLGDETSNASTIIGGSAEDEQDGDDYEKLWFYASIGFGFVEGFWGVCGTLLLKKSWRHGHFHFCDDIEDRIALIISLKVVLLKRKFGLEKKNEVC